MKINQNVTFLRNVADTPTLKTARESAGAQRAASATTAVAGQVQSSSPSPLPPAANGDFDAARVAMIREDISAGRYQINTAKIADGLLASVRELLNAKAS
ncbi:MAG: flagellar biosynthesis anti-sigma factor FlgM [Rhodoferax sp.]